MLRLPIVCVLAGVVSVLSGHQQNPTPAESDPVGNTLRATGLIHTDIGGFYKLRYDYSDTKRHQDSYIRKRVDTYESLSVQESYSLCYESKTAPDTELLRKVFQKSFSIGGLILEEPSKDQELWRIRFKIDVPTNTTAERLKTYLQYVGGTADGIEKELGAEDKL
ncbi:MAG: hypothetical protein JNM85_03755 [Chthonomonas sp.]|nr:hypothetical protein [Chthonomonas sp.]